MGKTARKNRKSRDYDKLPVAEKASPYDIHDGKGTAHVESDLLSPPRDFVPLDQLAPGHASPVRVILTMMATSVGATAVVVPYAILQGGFAMSIFMLVFVGMVTHTTRTRLVELGVEQGIYSFQGLAKLAFGPLGGFAVAVTQLTTSLGLIIALFTVAFQDMPIILGHWLKMDFDADGKPIVQPGTASSTFLILVADKFWFAEIFTLVVALPYCLYANSYKRMRVAPALVTIVLVAAAYSVVVKAKADHDANVAKSSLGHDRDYLTVPPSTVCQAFAILTMSVMSQHHSFHAFYAMRDRSTSTFTRISRLATLGSLTIALSIGIGGYLSFLGMTKSDLLHNYDFVKDNLMLPFWTLVPLAAVACVALEVVVCRDTTHFLCKPSNHLEENDQDVLFASQATAKTAMSGYDEDDQANAWSSHFLTAIPLILVAQIAIFYAHDPTTVLSLTGGLAGISLCFILPAACQLKLSNTHESWFSERIMPSVSIVVGVVGAIAAVVSTVVKAREDAGNIPS